MGSLLRDSFKNDLTKEHYKDTGMAMVLILLLLTLILKDNVYLQIAIGLHVLNMIAPQFFKPLAIVWIGFSHLLGTIMSKIVLSIIFFGVVTPIGVFRRVFVGDTLKLRAFKMGRDSVMYERNHTFSAKDIERPY